MTVFVQLQTEFRGGAMATIQWRDSHSDHSDQDKRYADMKFLFSSLVFLRDDSKGLPFKKLIDVENYQKSARLSLERVQLFRKFADKFYITNKEGLLNKIRLYTYNKYGDPNKGTAKIRYLDGILNRIIGTKELPDGKTGRDYKAKLEQKLDDIYNDYPRDSDLVDFLFDKIRYTSPFGGQGNFLFKYDKAIEHLDMLIDDVEDDFDPETDTPEEDLELQEQIDKVGHHAAGDGQWRRDIDDAFLMRIFRDSNRSDHPVYFETDQGLNYGKSNKEVEEDVYRKIVIPSKELEEFYQKSDNNFEQFKILMANKYQRYFKRLKGNYRDRQYDPRNEVDELTQSFIEIPNGEKELRKIQALHGKDGRYRDAYVFKHAKELNGKYLYTLDVSNDDMPHDEVKFYLDLRDDTDPDFRNIKYDDFNRIRVEHFNKGEKVYINYISLNAAIDTKYGVIKSSKQAEKSLRERLYRQLMHDNDLQFNYNDSKSTFNIDQAIDDWIDDVVKSYQGFTTDMIREDETKMWMQGPAQAWYSLQKGRKKPYYKFMIPVEFINVVYDKTGPKTYWTKVSKGEEEYDPEIMEAICRNGIESARKKYSDLLK